ncbi:MAG: 50S ribosomal protein L2 [Parcubacteria group bacterium]|nr:MAG: 50S ribosomal protein L2 [Parcubacteria group bacterium]
MPIKIYKPTTSARRQTSVLVSKGISKGRPHKSLLKFRKSQAGRNNQGKISVRHQGGGARRFTRVIDFKRDKYDIPAKVESIQYDPNRSANLALLLYADGERRYIIAPDQLKAGDSIISAKDKKVDIKVGNALPLKYIPTGTEVHNVETAPGKGGQLARSAGNGLTFLTVNDDLAQLKMPSGEIRSVSVDCLATIGIPSNPEFINIRVGKAGRKRHMGIRPSVRGKVMNPVDHPHGGGEGKHPIGMKHPKTYTGKPAFGIKTRKEKKSSNKFIVKRRKSRQTIV